MLRVLPFSVFFLYSFCTYMYAQHPHFNFYLSATNQPAGKTTPVLNTDNDFKLSKTNGAEFRFQLGYPVSEKYTILSSFLFGFHNLNYSSTFSVLSNFDFVNLPFKYQAMSAGVRRKLLGNSKYYLYTQASIMFMHYSPSSENSSGFFSSFFDGNSVTYDLEINSNRTRIFVPEVGLGYTISISKKTTIEANVLYSQSLQKVIKNGNYTIFYSSLSPSGPPPSTGTISKFHQNLAFSIGFGIHLF